MWVARYLAPEVLGTAAALLAAWGSFETTGSLAIAAVAGTVAETIGYYALILVRTARGHAAGNGPLATTVLTLRSLLAEFGPAELVDTLLVRPALLWAIPTSMGATPLAWLIAKLASDVVFYAITITSFEFAKRIILPHPKENHDHGIRLDTARPVGPRVR
ncbi:hypothetical protein ASF30_20940 [Leifsonia sp. Leaf264]|nr:hypothetical protein ASF30_20940 [Leifsonia sp. Leaf264]